MSTAVRVRHTNRTGLLHLSSAGPWRAGDAAPFGAWEPVRPRRRPPGGSARRGGAATRPQSTTRRQTSRHDLLPAGPGLAVCTACGCVFELHAYVASGRRLPACS